MSEIDLDKETQLITQAQVELDRRSEAVAAEQRRRLQAEHKVLVSECRSAKDEFSRLEAEASELQQQTVRTRSEAWSAECSLANHRASEPKASSYPTDSEMATWRRELKRREAAVKRANDADGVAVRAMLAARSARNIADENLQRFAEREAEVRERLNPPTSRSWATTTVNSSGLAII